MFEGHKFFLTKKLGRASNKRKPPTTCSVDYTYDIRFGGIIIQKIPKNGQQVRKLTVKRIIAFVQKILCIAVYAENIHLA